jgi:hypothetical protein
MARVLINAHRNVAIEVSRKDKWTTLITGWTPHKKIKILNSEVDREWTELADYPVTSAIQRFLKPMLQLEQEIDASAILELRRLLNDGK